jgi:hypothetical protein
MHNLVNFLYSSFRGAKGNYEARLPNRILLRFNVDSPWHTSYD